MATSEVRGPTPDALRPPQAGPLCLPPPPPRLPTPTSALNWRRGPIRGRRAQVLGAKFGVGVGQSLDLVGHSCTRLPPSSGWLGSPLSPAHPLSLLGRWRV